jgi:hypothetical protein
VARFENGYVKSYRSLWDGDLGDNPILLAIWVGLLHMATWKETKILWDGKQRVLPPGSVVFGIREFANRWCVAPSTVLKWLRYLVHSGRITLETSTRGSLATICNWETYQGFDEEVRTPSEHGVNTNRTPSEHEVNLIEEGNKVRKEEYINAPPSDCVPQSGMGAIEAFQGDETIETLLKAVKHSTQKLWIKTYPDIDWLKQEFLKAATWLDVNPRKRSKSMARFLGNWLASGWERHRKTIQSNPAQSGAIDIRQILARQNAGGLA